MFVKLSGLLVFAWAVAAHGLGLAATVSDTQGRPVNLAVLSGKPVVLFYEEKEATDANQALKDELLKRGREANLLSAVRVIAVANVRAYDWFPARPFVIHAVRDIEKKVGIPVYLDWGGALSRSPPGLAASGASVLLLDRGGGVRFTKHGRLSRAEMEALLGMLDDMVRNPEASRGDR